MTWAQWLALGAAKEAIAISKHSGTLSEAIARTARVETTPGKFAFTGALAFGSLALWIHIVRFEYRMKAGAR